MVKEEEYLLTNQEILGGLKSALERGQTLKQAMMSFYQAGYKKEEIEDAARAYLYLQRGVSEAQVINDEKERKTSALPQKGGLNPVAGGLPAVKKPAPPVVKKPLPILPPPKKEAVVPQITQTKVPGGLLVKKEEPKKVVQRISNYESKPVKPANPKSKALTVVLFVTLAILLGILALVFLFKAELVNFINGLFG